MAGEIIHVCRYAKHPAAAINGVTHAGITPATVVSTDPGQASAPGTAETLVTDRVVKVTLYGQDFAALLALLEATAANVVIGTKGIASALEIITIKAVYFDEWLTEITVKAREAGGTVPRFGIRGTAQWGTEDTFATMVVATADA